MTKLETREGLKIHHFHAQTDWESWLEKHGAQPQGIWLKFAKKGSGEQTVSYAEAVDSALCHGWIDGQKASLDAAFYLLKFTPRRPRSKWSKINRGKVEALAGQGRMKPAGLRQVELAKADGRWEAAYDSPSKITIPEDFQKALAKSAKATRFFETLSGANRYAILYRIHDAKRPETRQARIEKFIAMLKAGETIH